MTVHLGEASLEGEFGTFIIDRIGEATLLMRSSADGWLAKPVFQEAAYTKCLGGRAPGDIWSNDQSYSVNFDGVFSKNWKLAL